MSDWPPSDPFDAPEDACVRELARVRARGFEWFVGRVVRLRSKVGGAPVWATVGAALPAYSGLPARLALMSSLMPSDAVIDPEAYDGGKLMWLVTGVRPEGVE